MSQTRPSRLLTRSTTLLVIFGVALSARAFVNFEEPPISYSTTPAENPVTRLQARLDAAQVDLTLDPRHGYLPALLRELDIPSTSQTLVYAKTSRQRPLISPESPRALYFNDDVYVGQVNGGFLEVIAADARLGMVFYSLEHHANSKPTLVRETDRCLTCHAQFRTRNVPGLRLDSVFVDEGGEPIVAGGVQRTNHKTPFQKRWGGWYVQGSHGDMWHRGNQTHVAEGRPKAVRNQAAQNVASLDGLFDVEPYLEPTSDLTALMVLAHQADGHNYLIAASFAARKALHDLGITDAEAKLNTEQRATVLPQIRREIERLLEYFVFSGEAKLTSPIRGPSSFANDFEKQGPYDSQGRSLRQLDLQTRLLRYPLSYLIYSEQFAGMPMIARQLFFARLDEILCGEDPSPTFAHLSTSDRQAIAEILRETYEDSDPEAGEASAAPRSALSRSRSLVPITDELKTRPIKRMESIEK